MARPKKSRQKRKARQRIANRYQKAREDAQLAGLIETLPAGAVRSERVDPKFQGSQPLPGLIGQAVRKRWDTSDEMAKRQVEELFQISTDETIDPHVRVAAIRTSLQADQAQWERENPELAGKTKGGVKVGVGVQVNNGVGIISQEQLVEMLLAPEGGPGHPIEGKLLDDASKPDVAADR